MAAPSIRSTNSPAGARTPGATTPQAHFAGLQAHLTVRSRNNPECRDLWFEVRSDELTPSWRIEFERLGAEAVGQDSLAFRTLALEPVGPTRAFLVAREVAGDTRTAEVERLVGRLVDVTNAHFAPTPTPTPITSPLRPAARRWAVRVAQSVSLGSLLIR